MKTALLGGTFDPVHYGHLYIARESLRILALDQVRFMVSGMPPHKTDDPITDASHRLAMTSMAVAGIEEFVVSDAEIRRGGISYTIDSLEEAAREVGRENICFIAGSDVLKDIHFWKATEKLLTEFCIFFVQRPGKTADLDNIDLAPELIRRVRPVDPGSNPKIEPGISWLATLDPPGTSSSRLRNKIREREPGLERFLPADVLEYALDHHLYEKRYGNN